MGDCGCVYVDYDGLCEETSKTNPIANKEHKCDECNRKIQVGEKYERYTGKFEGEIFTNKTCTDCLSLRNEYFCGGWCYGQLWEHMWEHVLECSGKILGDEITRLTPMAREKVLGYVEEVWQDDCDSGTCDCCDHDVD